MKRLSTLLLSSFMSLVATAQIHLTADLQNNHLWRGLEVDDGCVILADLGYTFAGGHATLMAYGAIDHIAIDVKNIDGLFDMMKAAGSFKMLDSQMNGLPFWERGVKFFTIEGPNREKIEFCERL